MEYKINKGVGKQIELSGLQAQYIFIFCGGLVGAFFLVLVLFMTGVNQWICVVTGIVAILVLAKLTFSLSKKYGRWGLMKMQARGSYPRFVLNRRTVRRLLNRN